MPRPLFHTDRLRDADHRIDFVPLTEAVFSSVFYGFATITGLPKPNVAGSWAPFAMPAN